MQRNILITSADKRVELLLEFKKELSRVYEKGYVYGVDLNPGMSPACHIADASFKVPKVTSPTYVETLLRLCMDRDIRLIIPTIDTELSILSQNRNIFLEHGIEVMVPDVEFITLCRDKRNTIAFFESLSIKNPEARDKYNPRFPIFAKPYDGSLSSNIHILKSKEDLTEEILNDPKLLFMEVIDKKEYKEFTVDMYYDRDGYVKSIVPRERIEIRSGEVNKGATRKITLWNTYGPG